MIKMVTNFLRIGRYYLRSIAYRLFNPLYRAKTINIGGRELKVYPGTYTGIDKDDAWLSFLLKDTKVFFDIGANVGWTALLANIYGNPNRLVLIDPNAKALTLAAGNLILNNYATKSTFVNAFVSDKSEEKVKFFTIDTGAAGSMYSSHAKTASSLDSWYWITTVTLDRLVEMLDVIPDLIKIDVEGAESLVLNGASKLCSTNQVRIFVEMHSNQQLLMNKNAEYVLKWCNVNKYKAWYLTNGEELVDPVQIASRGRCHLLLLPYDQDYPTQLKSIKQGDSLPIIM